MSSTGQPSDKGVTGTRQERDKGVTPAHTSISASASFLSTLATLASCPTIGEAAGISGYTSFSVHPYSDQIPTQLYDFPHPATSDAVPPPLNGELHNIQAATAYVQRQMDEDTARLRLTRLEAEAAAVRRELRELLPRTQACFHCGTLFNPVKADGTVEMKVGKRRMYCARADDGTIIGSETCIKEREAQRQRDYRVRKLAQRQN